MNRFLKRPIESSPGRSSKRSALSKQGNVIALVRVAEFGKATFLPTVGSSFVDLATLVIHHVRKNTIERYLKSKVNWFLYQY